MRIIEIDKVKKGQPYLYYQQCDGNKYIAVVQVTKEKDIGGVVTLSDLCNFYKRNVDFELETLSPDECFYVLDPSPDYRNDKIIIFEMTDEEIERHLLMEML